MTILTITVNPALDISTDVEAMISGLKLRCGAPSFDPGGGGVNVSRAIAKLGGSSTPFVAIGGVTGQMFRTLLDEEGVETAWFDAGGLTRQSVMVYERSSGEQYRFVMPGPDWSETTAQQMLDALDRTIRDVNEPIRYVVASGSLAPGLPDDFYHQISQRADGAGARLVLDTSGRALETAARGRAHPPHIWVMDQGEAEQIAQRPVRDLNDLETLARELRHRNLAETLILSHGQGGAVAVSETETVRTVPPPVDVVSKVGAGDSFVAGLVLRLAQGADLTEACAFAVAAASSAVTTPATQLCDGEQAERFFQEIMAARS